MSTTKTMLLVDDEPNITRSIKRILRSRGYTIFIASSAYEALEVMAKEDVQVVLSDQLMPKMTGSELFEKIQKEYPAIVRILLTGYTAIEGLTTAVNKGAVFRILFKPWDDENLVQTIDDAFDYYFIRHQNRQLTEELKVLNANLENKVAEKTRDLTLNIRRLQLSQKLFELLPAFALGISDDLYIVNANEEAHQILGAKALIGQKIQSTLPEAIVDLINSRLAAPINEPQVANLLFKDTTYEFVAIRTEIAKDNFAYLLYASKTND